MKKRVERFKAALRKITGDTKLITFNIEERCEGNDCKEYLVHTYADSMKGTIMEIPWDFNFLKYLIHYGCCFVGDTNNRRISFSLCLLLRITKRNLLHKHFSPKTRLQ